MKETQIERKRSRWKVLISKPNEEKTKKVSKKSTSPVIRYANKKWERRFKELEVFKEKFNHLKVPFNCEYNALAQWVSKQIRNYNRKSPLLDKEKIAKLENLGITWEKNRILQWEQNYEQLKTFFLNHGHYNFENGGTQKLMRNWLYYQKLNWNKLSQSQIEKLENIGIDMC